MAINGGYMRDKVEFLLDGLRDVLTSADFENWVRTRLRRHVGHAALLGTFGKLYGLGSVSTHRVGVDFPLNLIEAMKDRFGAIDDPLVCDWFESGKLKYVDVSSENGCKLPEHWQMILRRYGMRSMLVFGLLDHRVKRFALFQLYNVPNGGSGEVTSLIAAIVSTMAEIGWGVFDSLPAVSPRRVVGHPTVALTKTELQIVEYLSMGLSNKEIAKRRGVSSSTVKTQVSRTGAKLGATRRAEIVAIGIGMLASLPAQGVISYDDYD
jgi:DNA-binding CsgD family transcriptional regulator